MAKDWAPLVANCKKCLAREWLTFLIAFFVGLFGLPPIWLILLAACGFHTVPLREHYRLWFEGLLSEEPGAWFWVLIPYVLFQFIRSIFWADFWGHHTY